MDPAARRRALDRAIPLLVGAVVVGFAAGSSSLPGVTRAGHTLRWLLLAALFVAALVDVAPRRPRLPTPPVLGAGALVGLALLSTAWSVAPRTSAEHAISLGLLFSTCLLLAAGAVPRERLLAGILGGAAAVGLAGLLLLAVDHHRAVQAASYEAPARFTGFGQDPNTVALLFAVTAPLAVWALVCTRRRVAAAAALLLFMGTIVASESRGALVAGAAGAAVVLLVRFGRSRATVASLAAVVAVGAVGLAVQSIPKPSSTSTTHAAAAAPGPKPKPGYLDAQSAYPLEADIGQPLPGGGQPPVRRSFFGGSGRLDAWRGALHEAARRPVAGHGFGTEQSVFVDRYYRFVGGLPENSYIGLALQLGIAGILALFALVAVLAAAGLRARRSVAIAGLGVLAAGLVIALVQSYLYSVGNIAAAALWIPAFLLGAQTNE